MSNGKMKMPRPIYVTIYYNFFFLNLFRTYTGIIIHVLSITIVRNMSISRKFVTFEIHLYYTDNYILGKQF